MLNETSVNISSQLIVQDNHISKRLISFDNKFEQIIMNSIIEATQFEPETTFENNIDEIKAGRVKIITSFGVNI